MGYGQNLKNILDEKHISVAELSRLTRLSATTLYSIIQRDSSIRFDTALRISNVLNIDIDQICKNNPFDDGEVLPDNGPVITDHLAKKNQAYIKQRTTPLLQLFDKKQLPDVDRLICAYFTLDDEGRKQAFDLLEALSKSHTDKERKETLSSVL